MSQCLNLLRLQLTKSIYIQPVQGWDLNRRYISGLEPEMPVTVRYTFGAIYCCAICTMYYWCYTYLCHLYGIILVDIFLCHLYGALLVPYTAVPAVRCTVDAMQGCATCTVPYWCHTLLCHVYGALLVPYIAVPFVRCTVGDIHCCTSCTVHCWCHALLCHVYGAILVPYIAVPSVRCPTGAIHCCAICTVHCWCHTLLCHLYSALLVPYIAVPFSSLCS